MYTTVLTNCQQRLQEHTLDKLASATYSDIR